MLMHLAELDEFISGEAQAAIETALIPRGVEVHTYAGCSHAFARHDGEHLPAKEFAAFCFSESTELVVMFCYFGNALEQLLPCERELEGQRRAA